MDYFKILPDPEKASSVNRTVRFTAKNFDRLMDYSEKTGISFAKLVNQCIEYALAHIDPSDEIPEDK